MTGARIGLIAPVIKRSGTDLPIKWLDKLSQLRINSAFGLIGRATFRFTDNGYSLSAGDTFALGTKVSVEVPGGGLLFSGTVTGINLEQAANSLPELVVVADDAAYALTRNTATQTYLNGTYSDAITQLGTRNGMTVDVAATTDAIEYMMQAGTDLAFLNAITARIGYSWFVDGTKLTAKKFTLGSAAATLTLGENLREFSVRASGLRPTEVSVHGWNPDQQTDLKQANSTPAASNAPTLLDAYTAGGPTSKLSAAKASVGETRALTAAEATQLADAYYGAWTSSAVVARGTAEATGAIKPGVTVQVSDAGPASGTYLVTSVEHVYDRTGFSSRFTSGPHQPAGLVDTLGRRPSDPGFVVSGLVVGVVTDNGDPDNAGRVKIRYTGVGDATGGGVASPWARVVTLGGGAARGAVFAPEVKDEVLVGFEHGDTRRPVVIGGLYSKQNTLPTGNAYVAEGQVNYRRITSRKNHIVEFADGDDATTQHILLQVGTAQHKLRLGADRFDIEVASGKPLTIKAGDAKFDISESGDVTIEGNNITIKAKTALNLEGTSTTSVKGQQTAIQGTEVQIKADGVGSVQASGPLTLKGATVAIN